MTNKKIQAKNVTLTRNADIFYSGGPLNSYDKVAEIVLKSLNGADGICFVICAVNSSLLPLCIQKISDNDEKQCLFSINDALKFAVASSAYGLIIAHNSIETGVYCIEDDLDIIRAIQKKCMLLEIRLIDYIIIDDHNMGQDMWFLSDNLAGFSGCYGQMDSKTKLKMKVDTMKYTNIPLVDMQEQEQKTLYAMYQIRSLEEAVSFAKNTIVCDRNECIIICAVDSDRNPTYIQTVEKGALWNHQFLVDIYKKAVLSDAVGVITFCIQKNRLTEIDFRDIQCIYELSRLGYGLGIKFMDHIILQDDHYLSFMKSNMLPRTDLLKEINKRPFWVDGTPILGPSGSIGPKS